ncbi:MAG: hypothetical protein IKG21_12080 [Atopobiaceae bacterium]|nr:hypothetical protein [Atopobiaceae bacterium]
MAKWLPVEKTVAEECPHVGFENCFRLRWYAIIGNGFDLECGLRTGYKDFLSFVHEGKYDDPPLCGTAAAPVDWLALRDGNYWFRRFDSVQIGCGWVDFENEIAKVTISVERSMYDDHGLRVFVDAVAPSIDSGMAPSGMIESIVLSE